MTKLKPIKIPEIRFKNGWLLTDAFVAYRKEIEKFKNDNNPPSWEKMMKVIEERKRIWKKHEKKILTAMQKLAGLNFYSNLIDVYTVYGWRLAFSEPLVISMRYEGEDFLDVLTHEIIHVLLTDNVQKKNGGFWPTMEYPNIKDKSTIHHILVHAIHKEIYLNVLKRPDRLERDIKNCQDWPSYKKAWEVVEKDGHMDIIERFRKQK